MAGGTAAAQPLRQDTGSTGVTSRGVTLSRGACGLTPALSHPTTVSPTCRAGSCPTAPTLLFPLWGVGGPVGAQGELLCHRHPLLQHWQRGAAVLAGIRLRLEQSVLVGSVPCRETTSGKGLGSLTHCVTHPAPVSATSRTFRRPGRVWGDKVVGGDAALLQRPLQQLHVLRWQGLCGVGAA